MNAQDLFEDIASKMTPAEAQRLIKGMVISKAAVAVATLVEICENKRLNAGARVMAAKTLLDRGFGMPEQNQPVIVVPGAGRTGVMLIPTEGGKESWLSKAQAHHSKMLT